MITDDFLYIDPSSVSAFIAMILGVVVGATIYIRTKWQAIVYRFKNKTDK